MREVYRGNGFVITANDSGEIFVANEETPQRSLRISSPGRSTLVVSYMNTAFEMTPIAMKMLMFSV